MNFEHLIEINSESLMVEDLSRQQLWQGLVMRAEQPELTVIGLDECRILERFADSLHRELRFGSFRIRDRVRFVPMSYVIYEVAPTEQTPASTLSMAIEEPAPGHLFVRFTYASQLSPGAAAPDAFYLDHVRQAYTQADIDTIATIRRLAREGALAGPR